jgi:hypothetical protein
MYAWPWLVLQLGEIRWGRLCSSRRLEEVEMSQDGFGLGAILDTVRCCLL